MKISKFVVEILKIRRNEIADCYCFPKILKISKIRKNGQISQFSSTCTQLVYLKSS